MVAAARIAHFNAARLKHPPGDPRVAEFVDNTLKVNQIAERSKGFVWRLADDSALVALDGYKGIDGDPNIAYSMSVWETLQDFEQFVYKTVHGIFFRKRGDWFEPWTGPNYVLWDYDGPGPIPTSDGWRRLKLLADHGPSNEAYDLAYAHSARTQAQTS